MWSGQPKEGSSQTPNTLQGVETVQNLGKAWDTISQTKAALRHIENKLEAAPTSTVVCDSVMSSKKTSANATRKISRKDGRYREDSSGTVSAGKSSSRGKICKEKSSRSPLRVTTFDSNVKKGNRVEFRDPLASYRETYSASSYLSASQLEAKALLDGVGVECAKAEADIHTVPNRDIPDFDSTRSSAIDNTVVRYLNDRPAIDALQSSEHVLSGTSQDRTEDVQVISGARVSGMDWTDSRATMKESELRGFNMTETPQSPASSTSSQRLEILRHRQPDAKLEKLKERIRKQWEHSEEVGIRNMPLAHSEQPVLVHSTESAASSAKVRKVAMAPPAPAYRGFNPTETKIRTPDGKVWPEAEFHNISRELYRDLALKDGTTTKEKGTDKSKEKKTARPVRKVQKVARGLSPDVKQGRGHAIGTSSWREGQKLVKKILGPPPKLEHGGRIESNDRGSRERTSRPARPTASTEADAQPGMSGKGRPRSFECIRNNMSSSMSQIQLEQKLTAEKPEKDVEEHLNKDFLPKEIRGILDDLQLESGRQGERLEPAIPCNKSGRSKSPIKRKPDKGVAAEEPQVTSKKRHYDSEQMRQYILHQQEERKKKQNEERTAQKEAREQKAKRLEELYKKQKEAFAKSRSMSAHEPAPVSRLHETYTKLTLEQTWLKEQTQMGQPTLVYQPSGESDKENKGHERPLSASSSSDLSLSEPPQPLGRSDLVDSTWMLPVRLSPRSAVTHPPSSRILLQPPQSERVPLHLAHGPANSDGGNLLSHLLTLENMAFLQKEGAPVLFTNRQIPTSAGRSLNLTLQTHTPSMDSRPDPMAKPTSQYQRKLDRIEALKATAASLSNRVESEARQLACGSVNYSVAWNTKLDLLRPSEAEDCWAKPVSPPVRDRHEDAFSARIQKMLDTCVTHGTFDADLPGVGNLHEYRKLPQTIRPFSAAASLGTRSFGGQRDEELPNQQSQKVMEPLIKDLAHGSPEHKAGLSHNSSAGSLSEGPLPSEGSLSEGDGLPLEHSLPNLTDAFQRKEFCTVSHDMLYGTMKVFRKEVEHFQPLPLHSGSTAHSKGPWAELAKGSPHSVINIYTKSYPYGNGGEDQSETKSSVFQPLLPSTSFQDSVSYEDDFSQSSVTLSEGLLPVEPSGSSVSSVVEELPSRGSPSQHSQCVQTGISSRSSTSSKKRSKAEKLESRSGTHLRQADHNSSSLSAEGLPHQVRKSLKSRAVSPSRDSEQNQETDSTLEDLSSRSFASHSSDTGRSQRTPTALPSHGSPSSFHSDSQENAVDQLTNHEALPSASTGLPRAIVTGENPSTDVLPGNIGASVTSAGSMRFSPAALGHQMAVELNYMSTVEESVRQLSDVERVRGISLAQQETVSLAQILKAQQQRNERDVAFIKLKAEQEAYENQRQLEESRQKAMQAQADTLQQLVQSRQETAEQLHIATSKIAEQQVEAARLTTVVAQQILEATELAHNRIAETVVAPAAPITTLFDRERQQHSEFMKQLRARVDTHRSEQKAQTKGEDAGVPTPAPEGTSDIQLHYSPSYDTFSESSRSKNHDRSTSSSRQESPSVPSSKEKDVKLPLRDKFDSSIEEAAHTAEDDSMHSESVPSLPDERDTTSIATEYSFKFDESMTEDEIEEKSFRSLLPSESHRRFNLEKRRGIRDDSDDEASPEKTVLTSVKELSLPFSEGQDSFSRFTMEMVRQYMKEEEMRAAHQSSLLRLRQRALKEKTKAELAWLEHQKKRLRDKGEDDKMPPIRKRQRGLLLKLQLEQAEIKRLQDASKAARKERQLILKQQEEIERIRQTTMKLQEKLKSAGEGKQDLSSEPEMKLSEPPSPIRTDRQSRSPSPVSISGSETNSIMQKLKKMRNRTDEKFLTKREQKLMQRRKHAEELLEWKRRLDAEEAEIRRIEKQALVVWDRDRPKSNSSWREESRNERKGNEVKSPVFSSHLHSESTVPEELGSLPVESGNHYPAEVLEDSAVTEDLASSQESKPHMTANKQSPSKSRSNSSTLKTASVRESTKPLVGARPQNLSYSWSEESLSMTQSETTSDQSDIESRIRALKDELKKRKSVVDQLKREQKKRQKERLKAQEASLIKQLESYDEFIKRTEAELSSDLEARPTAKPQIKTPSSSTEKLRLKAPSLQRPEAVKSYRLLSEAERSRGSLDSINESIVSLSPEDLQSSRLKKGNDAEDICRTPSPKSPIKDTLESLPTSPVPADRARTVGRFDEVSGDESIISSQRSDIPEEVIESEGEDVEHLLALKLDSALQLDLQIGRQSAPALQEDLFTQLHEPFNIHIDLDTESRNEGQENLENLIQEDQRTTSASPSHRLNENAEEHEGPPSGQTSFRRDLSYSEDFDVSSLRKIGSVEGAPRGETYKDDFESSSAISPKKEFHSEGPETEKSQHIEDRQSKSPILVSDDEISEHLSSKSLSPSVNIQSERLLLLKPTAELKEDESEYNITIEVDASKTLPSLPQPPLEANLLQGFELGDRVMVSNVQPGTLCFKGKTHFADGFWAGVELDKSEGNNDGTYNGTKYFECKEKHGIFAPPHKISHLPVELDISSVADDESYQDVDRSMHLEQEWDQEQHRLVQEEDNQIEKVMPPKEAEVCVIVPLTNLVESTEHKSTSEIVGMTKSIQDIELLGHDLSPEALSVDTDVHIGEQDSSVEALEDRVRTLALTETPTVELPSHEIDRFSTPLQDILAKEKNHLEAQLLILSSEARVSEVGSQDEKVSLLTDSLLNTFVKDTVEQLQEIQRVRHEKIHLSNRELHREEVPLGEESMPRVPLWQLQEPEQSTTLLQNLFPSSELEDEQEAASSPDLFPRPESPVFGASGQEELTKRLSELELRQEFLSVIGDDQDWFDEDYGISSCTVLTKQPDEPLLKVEPPVVKVCEEPILAVPHTIAEVEALVHTSTEELWKWKQQGHDLHSISFPSDFTDSSSKREDHENVSRRVYKEAVFDLTREIFGEIFAEDYNLQQPAWMKPYRVTSAYYRRVKNPNNLDEIKTFLTDEVLKLCSLKKEPNLKTDWQKMMKFGRKKRDRVDHILVQELHEEEAQWVNYDEDELSVKMQLADGVFEALLRDTVRVLQDIHEKQISMVLV